MVENLTNTDNEIRIGDCVKVIDIDGAYDEYVEFIFNDTEGNCIYGLSDGTWIKESAVCKYVAQGEQRRELIDKLNEVY